MHLSEVNIYPVKSLKGIGLQEAVVEERGLRHDRRWMLVDEKNQFLTQREHPRMATIGVDVTDNGLIIGPYQSESLYIPFRQSWGAQRRVTIWSSSVKAFVYSEDVNQVFSEYLGKKCSLVWMSEEAKRIVSPDYAVRRFKDTVSFADGYPFLLIGEASLGDLNERILRHADEGVRVPMNRFRPNFVVSGSKPFEEDTWKRIRIGETEFHVVKPCARCVLTTVDQATGEKNGKEPLKTLSTYRNRNGKVLFGQNLIAENAGGTIKVGDKVEILEARS